MPPLDAVLPALSRRPAANGCTCFKARRLARALVRLYDREMVPGGLTVGQFSLLRALLPRPLALSAMAREMGLDRTTLTRNLKPLIDNGLITAARGTDARVRLLSLSEQGQNAMRASRTDWRRIQCQIEDSLGLERVVALHDLLDETLATIERDFDSALAVKSDTQGA